MKKEVKVETKNIVLDEISQKFLISLKDIRRQAKLTQKTVAEYAGLKRCAISQYEHGQKVPQLKYLIKLAEILKYDLSGSLNYRIFHGELTKVSLKRRLKYFGLTYPELEKLTGYSTRQISTAVNFELKMSLRCLSAIMEVLEREQRKHELLYGSGIKKRLRI